VSLLLTTTMVDDASLCGAGLVSSRDVDAVSLTGGASSSSEVATVVSRGGGREAGVGLALEICGSDDDKGIGSDAFSCCCKGCCIGACCCI
jgi:hypothetical protein